MKNIVAILLVVISMSCHAVDKAPQEITPEFAMKAIQFYKQDPASKDAMGALSIVLDFAENSKTIIVEVKPEYFPYDFGSINEFDPLFLGAYVAGSVETQLLTKSRKDAPYNGITLLLYTYKKLREKGLIEVHSGFEKWLSLDKHNELRKWLRI